MDRDRIVIFVCEHGAAKSILAAAHFNRLAQQSGLDLHAVARGTNPDQEISPQTIKGLSADGLTPTESHPQKLTQAEIRSAHQIISFCELPAQVDGQVTVERWERIPPVSESYEKARDTILEHLKQLMGHL
jgi:protein-tyrosine-phosphatase